MQKIVPFLWFDTQAEEAAEFYTSIFKNSEITSTACYGKTHPELSGRVMTVNFTLEHQDFVALNGGPEFSFTPAISFFVTLEAQTEADALWAKLVEGGTVLMPLQPYDWSEKYGWLNDRYGLSWQISLGKRSEVGQAIVPSLLFVGKQYGKAEEALRFYTSLFEGSSVVGVMHTPDASDVQHAQFTLAGQTFMAMDSAVTHEFNFNEALSLQVNCDSQTEVDRLWNALSAVPEAEQCGWLKDGFGVSWQIVPTEALKLMADLDRDKASRVTEALMGMKKIDGEALRRAYDSK